MITLLMLWALLPQGSLFTGGQSDQAKTTEDRPDERHEDIDSIVIGEPVTCYEIPYLNDHSLIYNPTDKKWHLFGIISGHTKFIHLTADFLTRALGNDTKIFMSERAKKKSGHRTSSIPMAAITCFTQ